MGRVGGGMRWLHRAIQWTRWRRHATNAQGDSWDALAVACGGCMGRFSGRVGGGMRWLHGAIQWTRWRWHAVGLLGRFSGRVGDGMRWLHGANQWTRWRRHATAAWGEPVDALAVACGGCMGRTSGRVGDGMRRQHGANQWTRWRWHAVAAWGEPVAGVHFYFFSGGAGLGHLPGSDNYYCRIGGLGLLARVQHAVWLEQLPAGPAGGWSAGLCCLGPFTWA